MKVAWRPSPRAERGNISYHAEKRAFTDSELLALLQGADRTRSWKTYPYIRDLMVVGLYSGMRLNEICSLLVRDITPEDEAAIITVRSGKTEAASRELAFESAP